MKGKSKGWSGSPKHSAKSGRGAGHVGGVAGSPDSGTFFKGVKAAGMGKASSNAGKSPRGMGKPYTEE